MSNPLQRAVDSFWDRSLFWLIPKNITPNHFTFIRFFLIPFVLYFLATGQIFLSLLSFTAAALADSIDGSLARKRGLISDYGIMLDPMADKLLISLLALFLLFYYPYILLLVIIIVIDLLIGLESLVIMIVRQDIGVPTSNWTGKNKMVFQVIGLILALLYLMTKSYIILDASIIVFIIAIFMGVISFFSYSYRSIQILKKSK